MAERENINSRPSVYEAVVNRWFIDYCFHLAIELFKKNKHADFLGVENVLTSLLTRPLEITDATQLRVRILQFLSCINEVENLNSLDTNQINSLESALELLESINEDFNIPPQDYQSVCTSIKELILVVFIKREEFDKAEEMLNKYFPRSRVGKNALLTELIKQKSHLHPAIQQVEFQQFRDDTLAFCQKICPLSTPFLLKAAVIYLDKRDVEPDGDAAYHDEEISSAPSPTKQLNICVKCLPRLSAAYEDLAVGPHSKSFHELKEELQKEENSSNDASPPRPPTAANSQHSEADESVKKDSASSVEPSTSTTDTQAKTDGSPQTNPGLPTKTATMSLKRRLFTVARLVVEPDSQSTSPSIGTSREEESEAGAVRLQEAEESSQNDLQSPVKTFEIAKPVRKHRRKTRNISSSNTEENVSNGDDSRRPVKNRAGGSITTESHGLSPEYTRTPSPAQKSGHGSPQPKRRLMQRVKEPQESPDSRRSSRQKSQKQIATPCRSHAGNTNELHISDSSSNSSPSASPPPQEPKTSSTPHKEKWKQLVRHAQESKDDWSDEDSLFPSVSKKWSHDASNTSPGQKRKAWTNEESNKLKEGVEKFGEGNWGKIKAYFSFKDRTNVNLKDRWRTMKKLNMV